MRNEIIVDNIGDLGKNLKEMIDKLEELIVDNDIYIRTFGFNINLENKNEIFKALNFAVQANSEIISQIRRETAKTRKKGDVGKKKSLSKEQEIELIEYIQDGFTRQDASERFGVSPSTVSRVLKRYNVSLKPGPKNN